MPLRSQILLFSGLGIALIGAVVLGLSSGPIPISWGVLFSPSGPGGGTDASGYAATALLQIRLPRVLLAVLIGAALAQAGAAMQGLLRNPLADPGLIGVSSGAALGGVAMLVIGGPWLSAGLPIASFLGGLLAALLALQLARSDGHTRMSTLLLGGLALNALGGAGIGFLALMADDTSLRSLNFWLFGSLAKASWQEVLTVMPLLLVPLLLLPGCGRSLNALLLGEAEAQHLGVDLERLKRRVLLLSVLAVAASVAAAGIIGFVGLLIPQLLRLVIGPDQRQLLPASALAGAILLVLADTAARTLFLPGELPIGILTALMGAPFFIGLLVHYRQREELA